LLSNKTFGTKDVVEVASVRPNDACDHWAGQRGRKTGEQEEQAARLDAH